MARVLVVAENENTRYLLERMLDIDKHETLLAYNFREGLAMAWEEIPEVVLIDNTMRPQGVELCTILAHDQYSKDMPLILLTAHADAAYHGYALAAGATAILVKPFGPEDILKTVERWLHKDV